MSKDKKKDSTAKKKTAKKTAPKAATKKKVPTASTVAASATKSRTKAAPAKKKAAVVEKKSTKRATISAEERYRMIEQAAYFAAERDGFNGDPQGYWGQAEAEVNSRLKKL